MTVIAENKNYYTFALSKNLQIKNYITSQLYVVGDSVIRFNGKYVTRLLTVDICVNGRLHRSETETADSISCDVHKNIYYV